MYWLGPMANDPHESPVRASARGKMDWLKAQLAAQPATVQASN
jgi:hypothetical protein